MFTALEIMKTVQLYVYLKLFHHLVHENKGIQTQFKHIICEYS